VDTLWKALETPWEVWARLGWTSGEALGTPWEALGLALEDLLGGLWKNLGGPLGRAFRIHVECQTAKVNLLIDWGAQSAHPIITS